MNFKVKAYLKVILIISLFFISFNIVQTNSSTKSSSAIKNIALVLSVGGLGDKSFNDAAFAGAQRVNDTSKVHIDYAVPNTVTDINTYIEQYASSTNPSYDLIIAIGFSSAYGINQSSLAHPSKNFAIIDDNSFNRSNVADISFKEQEGSFLAGAMAAMVSQTGTIGFLGGLDIPLINKFRSGYEQGAHYINPNITVLSQYSPDINNPWGDTAGGKLVADNETNYGADIIYAAAGGTGLGVFDSVSTSRSNGKLVYAIGVDSDQDYLDPGIILTSMVKRVDVVVADLISSVVDGTFSSTYGGTSLSLGLAENGVGISNMSDTLFIKNSLCTPSKTRYGIVQDLNNSIVNGNILVSSALLSNTQFNTVSHSCTEAVPVPTGFTSTQPISTTTTTTSSSSSTVISSSKISTTTSLDLNLSIFYLLPVFVLVLTKKRKIK